MAKAILTNVVSQAHGRIGDYELRRHKGQTVLQARQKRRAPWSRKQHRQREHFAAHIAYARSVGADPALRAHYDAAGARQKKPLNYFQMAVRDHAHAPDIPRFEPADFRPDTGGEVRLYARDDCEVTRVHVIVRDAAGTVLHHGDAEPWLGRWRYAIPPAAAGAPAATHVVATVFDRPGNFSIGTLALPVAAPPATPAP